MKDILFILDRAHGKDVKGKRSPDGKFLEWEYSQKTINKLQLELTKLNIPWVTTVDEPTEPGLAQRVIRANKLSEKAKLPILLSFHNNAGGGSGIEIFTNTEENEADKIAHIIGNRLIKDFVEIKYRKSDEGNLDKDKPFVILEGTKEIKPKYHGILLEFLFMDNVKDLEMLRDEKVFNRYIECILYAIVEICHKYKYGNFLIV